MSQDLPVDLAVLGAQTGGDERLAREVLLLFVRDAPGQAEQLLRAELAARAALAHRLVGSARAVGAHDLARAAAEIERGRGDVDTVAVEASRAVAFISAHLAGEGS